MTFRSWLPARFQFASRAAVRLRRLSAGRSSSSSRGRQPHEPVGHPGRGGQRVDDLGMPVGDRLQAGGRELRAEAVPPGRDVAREAEAHEGVTGEEQEQRGQLVRGARDAVAAVPERAAPQQLAREALLVPVDAPVKLDPRKRAIRVVELEVDRRKPVRRGSVGGCRKAVGAEDRHGVAKLLRTARGGPRRRLPAVRGRGGCAAPGGPPSAAGRGFRPLPASTPSAARASTGRSRAGGAPRDRHVPRP